MASKIDRWLEGYVTELSEQKYLYQQNIKWCKNLDYCISKKGIYTTLYLKGKKHLADSKNEIMTTEPHSKIARTQATIKKVKSLILKENSPAQRFISLKLGMSYDTAKRITKQDSRGDTADGRPYLGLDGKILVDL
ncbi:hypothetical protein TNCV_4438921 [Trichonephila clavipes]|nr:hypothetical protein TNCV_4438921 [Trichonephila clavipes]